MTSLYDFSVRRMDGTQQPLADYRGKVVLIVNVASQCGHTPQYAGLEALWREHRDAGLVVLGFPCNQFGEQEPGSEAEIAAFCSLTYDVTFPVLGKIAVNGRSTDPLYRWLKSAAPGLLGLKDVKWNFTKFLVDRSGRQVTRYGSATQPEALADDIREPLPSGCRTRCGPVRAPAG
jgi:glutathione peroxidase